ncbi:Putative prophage CPS-53 integrase [Providencia rustigianii]|uniref:Prophage CPS-53 integrase n=1 Tax=Providencia rustigianii TaxID=158850 RepID=A0A379G768_9GAMM|nr:DUF4102 domain-containing protein [Providencia rustigianii]SPY78423.1 Putative prophage CPS-53 integrase [Providencia rustigianii]SUC36423.1 Putative prophage CPS-53 integrase [Providencia rustigianii]VEB72252.1 Putative prophage CPS-53 integrase [Providencia rustigianii]VEH56243.1 Putative prophage CPS-53 integrase [Providencia rustigianii]
MRIDAPSNKANSQTSRASKPKDKAYKLSDGGGMYLEVTPNGSKYWRMKYRYAGKEKRLALGVYPSISLAQARAKREEAKRILALGDDPSLVKKAEKREKESQINNSFEKITLEWHDYKKPNWSEGYADDLLEAFQKDIFPYIGKVSITEIKPLDMLEVFRKFQKNV